MRRLNYSVLFYLVASGYSLLYLVIYFSPNFHDFHTSYLILGVFLLIFFIFQRSRGEYRRPFQIGAYTILLILIFHFVIEISAWHNLLYASDVTHFLIHVIFSLAYLIFSYGIFKETENYQKNRKIRQAIFEFNEAIIFEFDRKNQRILIEISNKMMQHYHFKTKQFCVSVETFQAWVEPEDLSLFRCLYDDEVTSLRTNTIFHFKIEQQEPVIAIQIKGSYQLKKRVVYIGFDFTDMKNLEQHIAQENQTRLTLLKNLQVGVMEIELIYNEHKQPHDYRLLYLNQALAKMMNQEHKELHIALASSVIPNQYLDRIHFFHQALAENRTITFEAHSELSNKWHNITAYPTKNQTVIAIFQDIDQLVKLNLQLEYANTHNKRNHFLNYTGLMKKIKSLPIINQALCFYGTIHQYANIKAFYGQENTDELIKQIAAIFEPYIEQGHLVANIAENQFVFIALNPSHNLMEEVLTKARESVYRSYPIFGTEISVKLNIGTAYQSQSPVDLLGLINDASIASSRGAKEEHNVLIAYEPYMSREIEENIDMARRLYRAMEEGRIQIYFQKVVHGQTKDTIYVEALARWYEEGVGFVPPNRFIALATESNIIDHLDEYLVSKTLQEFVRWQSTRNKEVILNINLSPSTLFFTGFDSLIYEQTIEAGLKPSQICVEISENTFVRNTNLCIERIKTLKEMGYMIAIDDFGSKYSSLGILDLVPYDMIKMDGVFAQKIDSPFIQELVKALVAVSHSYQKQLVIECIETKEQSQKFIELGCYLQQGYYHHKPQPPKDIND